ncbi:MAG: AMP-binding protein, partial [Candidatus Dadabacteria bacterium]|nr:AMP-binding protein [Candidatus Dadabacteria bacterium]NIQ15185.1 AMP-binding protein [Candidatus Dadabacteria bacterium]
MTYAKKAYDLRHPITYKRQTEPFDVEWYKNKDKNNWVLPKVLKKQAKELGSKPFLQFGYKNPLSFYKTNKLANKIANGLTNLRIEKGDKVAVYMPNSDDYVITWFGILKMGAVMVPINTAYKMDFLQYIIDSSDSKVLFIAEEYLDRMVPIA